MGLDISIHTDNFDELYPDADDYFDIHSLSRTFCNFISRRHVVEHQPELEQIGIITGIDVSPLYEMENYWDEENLEISLEFADDEEEKRTIMKKAEEDNSKIDGNIDKVLKTVEGLISSLNSIINLNLLQTDFDTLNNEIYFANFKDDKGKGYIDNNFGQDLRNFRRFLEYAKEHGSKTVWFKYN